MQLRAGFLCYFYLQPRCVLTHLWRMDVIQTEHICWALTHCCEDQSRHADDYCKNSFIIQGMSQIKGLLVLFKAPALCTDNQKQLLLGNFPQRSPRPGLSASVTVVFVGAVRVAVDDAGLPVRGPASVSDAEVREELLVQVQQVFLWRQGPSTYQYRWGHQPEFTNHSLVRLF